MATPVYSVVIPAHNEATVIGECIFALRQQSVTRASYEVIVVDDGSEDETALVAKDAGADAVLTIDHGGPAAARNAGIERARGRYVLFTDADCVASPNWIACMVAPFDDPEVVGTKGTYRTRQRSLMARLTQLEFEIRYERMLGFRCIDFIDTYAAAYRAETLRSAGGFNTDYIAAEDVELSFRLARAGHCMVFVPDAWVWHTHPDTLSTYLRRKVRFGYWRALLYMRLPEKIGGDAHTDPVLKPQFAIVASLLGVLFAGLFVKALIYAAIPLVIGFLVTTLPFVRWAWGRDRAVAWVWPVVTFLRVLLQGASLGVGLVVHKFRSFSAS